MCSKTLISQHATADLLQRNEDYFRKATAEHLPASPSSAHRWPLVLVSHISSQERWRLWRRGKHVLNAQGGQTRCGSELASARPELSLLESQGHVVPWKQIRKTVLSRLDNCNIVFTGLSKKMSQTISANTERMEHITRGLKSPHWLPVWQRFNFKCSTCL